MTEPLTNDGGGSPARGNGPALVDTHCHLDERFFPRADVDAMLARAGAAGVERVVAVGIDLASSREVVELAASRKGVYVAVGVHPTMLEGYHDGVLDELAELAASPRVVAIGEIGLDYYRDRAPRDVQRRALDAQLELASSLDLPVIIHDREAHDDVTAALVGWARPRARPSGVLHCFSGDVDLASRMSAAGFLISLAGNVSYPSARNLHDVAREVPLASLVVETDAPYLSPQGRRGRTNEPAHVRLTAEKVAELRGTDLAEVAEATTANAARLFRWGTAP